MSDIAYDYLILARQLASNKRYKEAFEVYLYAFDQLKSIKKRFQQELRAVLSKINLELEAANNKPAIFQNFERAFKKFPDNVELMQDIGSYLHRYGFFAEAMSYFEKALKINSYSASIEKSLNNAKAFLFPRCHFRILNDKLRNDTFRNAIRSCVTTADNVLVLDAGTGLLPLYAHECIPSVIRASESSTTMARLAVGVMQDNHTQVFVVNKPTIDLGRSDIGCIPSVLITDRIDSGVFGEYILQHLCHAWRDLLDKDSKVIPGRAEYFVAGVRCEELKNKFKLCHKAKILLNVEDLNVHTMTYYGETYYSEDVHLYEDLQYMTEPQLLLEVDFNDQHDMYEKLCRQEPYNAELTALEDGEINSIIGWFNLHLTEEIMVTNDPRSESNVKAWQQAVFFDVLPKKLLKDESATVPFITYGGRLSTLQEKGTKIMRISPETLAFLNDTEYIDMITKCVGAVFIHLEQTVDVSYVDMIDLSPFPLLGVFMLKRGANSLICHAKTINDKELILAVLRANNIAEDKVTILFSDHWSYRMFKDRKFHVIFTNIIEFSGDLEPRKKRMARRLKRNNLAEGGLYLPAAVSLMGQLINSSWLETNSRVLDENVDYKLASRVNQYQTSQVVHLDVARLKFKPLSEQFDISCCSHMKSDVIGVTVTEDGECHAVLCWYKVQLMKDWHVVYSNRKNSFVESMAFLTSSSMPVSCGDRVSVGKCVDADGSFKLRLSVEPSKSL